MATVKFAFTDPRASGVDAPTGAAVRCSLVEAGAVSGVMRSTREFVVPLVAGAAEVPLSAGVWRVEVEGVEGVRERYVQVPTGDAVVSFTDLPDVDPVTSSPEAVPMWQTLQALVDGLTVRSHPTAAGVLVVTVPGEAPPAQVPPTVAFWEGLLAYAGGSSFMVALSVTGDPAPVAADFRFETQTNGGAWTQRPAVPITGVTEWEVTGGTPGTSAGTLNVRVTVTTTAGTATDTASLEIG